jgi:Asp/Glu/hydantoin racemase
MEELGPILKSEEFDAFLVACYSVHPLVSRIEDKVHPSVHVIGIFEASVTTALSLLPQRNATFGIVSTGSIWESLLTTGVKDFLGGNRKFQGVKTTGLTAAELHETHPEIVKKRVMEATKRLVRSKNCTVVCLGCAGMVGMEEIVREAIVEELGREALEYIRIVDPVRAGVAMLESMELTIPGRR